MIKSFKQRQEDIEYIKCKKNSKVMGGNSLCICQVTEVYVQGQMLACPKSFPNLHQK